MANTILKLSKIKKSYPEGKGKLTVLDNISLEIKAGETVALFGASGCGKSTLLHIAGLLDLPDSGKIEIDGEIAGNLNEKARTKLRRKKIGFIYQNHHLLPDFSALENIMLPQIINGVSKIDAEKHAKKLLKNVNLTKRAEHRPAALSGGEQQRVAIARSIANSPKILLADEPTGNLDPENAETAFKMLKDMVEEKNLSLLMVTHNHDLGKKLSRVIEL